MTFTFLIPFYQWIDTTWLSQFLQESTYTFPVVEVIHIMGITMLLGAAIAVSLRLMGWGMKRPVSEIYDGLVLWSWLGMFVVVTTGLILTIAEPIKLSTNSAFPYKLVFLAAGMALHFFGLLKMVKPGKAEANPGRAKLVGIGIQVCWFGAGIMGRAIGFV
jgi:hypothetical protein